MGYSQVNYYHLTFPKKTNPGKLREQKLLELQ